jgi:hypothetical protein
MKRPRLFRGITDCWLEKRRNVKKELIIGRGGCRRSEN